MKAQIEQQKLSLQVKKTPLRARRGERERDGRNRRCILGDESNGDCEKGDSGGLVWKRIKLTTTRKANAKKRLIRVWQNEAVLRAYSEPPPLKISELSAELLMEVVRKTVEVH